MHNVANKLNNANVASCRELQRTMHQRSKTSRCSGVASSVLNKRGLAHSQIDQQYHSKSSGGAKTFQNSTKLNSQTSFDGKTFFLCRSIIWIAFPLIGLSHMPLYPPGIRNMAMSTVYCGKFVETLGTTPHLHNSANQWYYSAPYSVIRLIDNITWLIK